MSFQVGGRRPSQAGLLRAVSVEKACDALKACEPYPPLEPRLAGPAALADHRIQKLIQGARLFT